MTKAKQLATKAIAFVANTLHFTPKCNAFDANCVVSGTKAVAFVANSHVFGSHRLPIEADVDQFLTTDCHWDTTTVSFGIEAIVI